MADQPRVSEEIKKMEHEPLLPAEKKMIIVNLVLGVFLLVVLVWVSRTYFPPDPIQAGPMETAATESAAVPGK